MKKIFTYATVAILVALLFTSCRKDKVYDPQENWLSQERGNVVYSSNYCGFYVIETNYGYTVVQNLDGLRVYDGDVLYGYFGGYGTRDFYNYSAGVVTRGDVLEYDLSYYEAQDAIDYYCPFGKSNRSTIRQSETSENKSLRTTASVKE